MKRLFSPALAALILLLSACTKPAPIDNMKCEYLADPICIDNPHPHFSWNYTDAAGEDFVEAGSKIEIAENEADLGKGEDITLEPLKSYVWRVIAWNADSSKVLTSPIAHFETALFSPSDWKAKWISDDRDKDQESTPMLRKEFTVKAGIAKARLYMSAAAYADMTINGKRAYEARLEPGYTEYDKRNLYGAYDVTELLNEGTNCMGAVLGNGFYNELQPLTLWQFQNATWRGRARLLAELHVTYKDGSEDVTVTDGTWKVTDDGPFIHSNLYAGDTYDARKEMPGWDQPGYDDSQWKSATEQPAPSGTLTAQKMPAIEPVKMLEPVSIKNWGDTLYVCDFGQNIAGVCEICVQGEAGTKVTITHTELRNEDGSVNKGHLSGMFHPMQGYDFQTDVYYMKGGEQETWRPTFTYHGFQYAEVKVDRPMKLDEKSIKAVVMHSNVQPAGTFSCQNEMFNTLWDMARKTYLNNLHSIFTDCPHREKNGWTADNALTTELALLDFDIAPYFINKWACDVIDNIREDGRVASIMPDYGQGFCDFAGPVWDSAIFTIAEQVYDYTGDMAIISKLWPVYKHYLDYLQTREGDNGLMAYGLGDWVFYNTETPTDFVVASYYYKDWSVMARFAQAMGEDPAPYVEKTQVIRDTINAKWFDPETNLYANGSQAAQGIALYLGIAPADRQQAIADNLASMIEANGNHLDFGSIGSKTVPRMLTKYGHFQTAYEMAAKEDCPSWGYWIKQGMTTLSETWKVNNDSSDSSHDHAFLGDIAAWYVNDIVGINPDPEAPGFSHIIIRPHFPKGMDWAKASYNSVKGTINASWKRTDKGIEMEIDIPVNTTATLYTEEGTQDLKAGGNKVRI